MAVASEKQIRDEIVEKITDYDQRMSLFNSDIGEWAEMFKVRPPARKERTFSNPRQTEFYRACSAVAVLMYRMMTSADPFFTLQPADLNADYDKLDTLSHVLRTQLKFARYRANLLRACHFAPAFGTVICQEDYRVMGISPFGRKIPVTTMIPRVLDQVMFDRGTLNIHEADWLATADLTSAPELMRLAHEAKTIDAPWNPKALEAAAKHTESNNTINWRVLQRIRRSGFTQDEAFSKKKELVMYYGKLDCMKDGIEYVAALVNRKFLVRFHPNNFQHGRRPFRVAKWTDFDMALGYGLGQLLAPQHRAMDANRQKAQDLFSFGAYNMMKRRRNTVADDDLVIKPLQIVDVDAPDDLTPIETNTEAGDGILKLDEMLKQEFRAAANASDAMMAISSDATSATASSLAQNEAMRGISVKSEHMADSLVREHIENCHWNNVQNVRAPFNVNKSGIVKRVYPVDLRMDVDIEPRCTTDKDFTPKRIERLIQVLQILTSTKSQHPDQLQVSILPLVKEIAYSLEVNPNEVIQPMNAGGMPMAPGMGAGDMSQLASMMAPGATGPGPGGISMTNTPAGPTMIA